MQNRNTITLIAYSLFCLNAMAQKIEGVRLESFFPSSIILRNPSINDSSYTEIYIYNDWTLIKSSYEYTIPHIIKKKEIIDTVYKYAYKTFIYSEKFNKGILIDSFKMPITSIVNKDSLLEKDWPQTQSLKLNFEAGNPKLLIKTIFDNGDITEKYRIDPANGEKGVVLTLIINYSRSKYNDVHYSFYPELEKVKGMKIIKYTYTVDPIYMPKKKMYSKKLVISNELKPIEKIDTEKIMSIIDYAKGLLK